MNITYVKNTDPPTHICTYIHTYIRTHTQHTHTECITQLDTYHTKFINMQFTTAQNISTAVCTILAKNVEAIQIMHMCLFVDV